LVIEGHDSEVNQKEDSGIPVLQHLPLEGMSFKHTSDSKVIKERTYVISPFVVECWRESVGVLKFRWGISDWSSKEEM
jgi:type II secretory pathway component GspD/PulD (secretin)